MKDLIYIYHNNQQEGPYTFDQIQELLKSGSISSISLAWKEGMSDWVPLQTLFSQQEKKEEVPPPPPAIDASSSSNTISNAPAIGPKGVGGWLLFFCIALTTLGPLLSLGFMASGWTLAQSVFEQVPFLKIVTFLANIGVVAILVYGFVVGCIILSGNPNGRLVAKIYLLVRLIGITVITIYTILFAAVYMPSEVLVAVIGSSVGIGFRELIFFLIWWFYFKKSKRVRNTYGVDVALVKF